MKNFLFFTYLLVVSVLFSCKSTKNIQDPTLLRDPEPPVYDYSQMDFYGFDEEKDSAFFWLNEDTNEWEQYIVEKTRYVVVTPHTYYLIRFENKEE